MPTYLFKIEDGKEAEVTLDEANDHAALNAALNALATFACKNFPPPDNVKILIREADGKDVAAISFSFTIDYHKDMRA